MKRFMVVLLGLLALTACSLSSNPSALPKPTPSVSGVTVNANGCQGVTHQDPALNQPGCYAVSTMKLGQQFETTPNFYYYRACGRPCWLPLYPSPILVGGTAVTRGEPCEYYRLKTSSGFCQNGEAQADQVHVICQVLSTLEATQPGASDLTDDAGHHSNIWDQVYVPAESVVGDISRLRHASDGKGYLAYGADLWLENTGWHDIPCPTSK